MDFNLKNYNAVNINIHSKRFTTRRKINKLNSSLNYDFLQVIHLLKNNQELSPASNYKVTINFENFSGFSEFMLKPRQWFYNFFNKPYKYPTHTSSMDFKNSIHIMKDIYSTETSFTEYLNKNLTENEVLIYTFLHELGHSVHSYLKNTTKLNFSSNHNFPENIKNFLNDSIPFKDVNSLSTNSYNSNVQNELEKDLSLASHYGMKEGFADLYACIAVSLIYPKSQAEHIINSVIEGRNYSDKWNKEFYHSKNSVAVFLNDFRNKNLQFNKFTDIQNYIEKTIAHTIVTTLKQQINNEQSNDNFVNHYFGVLKNKLKPEYCNSLTDIITYVNETYGLNLQQRNQNEFFNLGFESSHKASPNPQLSNKNSQEDVQKVSFNISSLRKKISFPDIEIQKRHSKNKI